MTTELPRQQTTVQVDGPDQGLRGNGSGHAGPPMNTRIQMFCLWCGPIGILFWLIGFVFCAGLIPPPEPSNTAEGILRFYQSNPTGIRAGLLLTMIGASLTAPWVAAITTQLKRIEGQYSTLAYVQLGTGMLGITLFIFPVMFMQAAAFRPERNADLVLLINDMAWIPFVGVWSLAFIQNLAIGLAVFLDREQKVYPRWFGYYNLWSIILYTPGSFLYFFKTGPLAWNGALSWWLVVVDFCIWFPATFVMTRRAIYNNDNRTGSLQPIPMPPQPDAALAATTDTTRRQVDVHG